MSHPAQVFTMLEDLNIPTAVVRYCIFPYLYENTTKIIRRNKRNFKDCKSNYYRYPGKIELKGSS
jgi:hypothetical protein